MSKNKSVFLLVIIAAILLFGIIRIFSSSENETRFKTYLKQYDEMYSNRLKQYENENIIRCYDLDNKIGFIAASQGYEDIILVYVELNHVSVEHVEVLYHEETEDYGDLVVEDWFLQRMYLPYENRLKIVKNRKTNTNEVIAITGATITSDAVVNAINECAQIMEDIKK